MQSLDEAQATALTRAYRSLAMHEDGSRTGPASGLVSRETAPGDPVGEENALRLRKDTQISRSRSVLPWKIGGIFGPAC